MEDASDDLTVDASADGDTVLLRVAGEIDTANVDAITRAAHDAVAAGATKITLDMSGVTFMDSSGIGAMIVLQAIAAVRLRHPSAVVGRLIATTGLSDVFEVEP